MAPTTYGYPISITLLVVLCVGMCCGYKEKKFVMDEADIPALLAMVANHTQEIETLKRETQLIRHQPVSFVAYLSKNLPGNNHQIIFDDVKLNMGNSYHVTHGNFIVPVDGLYQLTVTACSPSGHYVVLELTVNAVVVDKVLAGDDSYSDCNTGLFLHQLSAGDDVYVQHLAQGDYLLSAAVLGKPMFSGVLLNAM